MYEAVVDLLHPQVRAFVCHGLNPTGGQHVSCGVYPKE